MRGSRMPEPWNSATQVARNLKGIDLDRISIIQIDLPVENGAVIFEATKIMLAQWIVVGIEAVIVSHRAQDLSASAKSAKEGHIPDQRGNARGHDDLVTARAANRSPQAVIQCGDAVDPLGSVCRLLRRLRHGCDSGLDQPRPSGPSDRRPKGRRHSGVVHPEGRNAVEKPAMRACSAPRADQEADNGKGPNGVDTCPVSHPYDWRSRTAGDSPSRLRPSQAEVRDRWECRSSRQMMPPPLTAGIVTLMG